MPKVSVIIPVYNAELFLRECLDSVIQQTLEDIEIICVDDGSTDNSLNILQECAARDNRIKILTQQNQYAGVARNYGMSIATGEYFVFLDSDDFFEPNMLEEEYNKCKEYNADICICGSDDFNNNTKTFTCPNSRINYKLFSIDVINKEILGSRIFRLTAPCPWNKMFRASFLQKHNLLFQPLPRANDVYFVLCSLFLAERIVGINKNFVHYRVENDNSLQGSNFLSPGVFFTALDGIYERLNMESQPAEYKRAFSNFALEQIGYNLRKVNNIEHIDVYNYLYDLVLNTYLAKYDILGHTADYFFNHTNLRDLVEKNVISSDVWNTPAQENSITYRSNKLSRFILCCRTRGIGYTLKYSAKRIFAKITGKSVSLTNEKSNSSEKEPVHK